MKKVTLYDMLRLLGIPEERLDLLWEKTDEEEVLIREFRTEKTCPHCGGPLWEWYAVPRDEVFRPDHRISEFSWAIELGPRRCGCQIGWVDRTRYELESVYQFMDGVRDYILHHPISVLQSMVGEPRGYVVFLPVNGREIGILGPVHGEIPIYPQIRIPGINYISDGHYSWLMMSLRFLWNYLLLEPEK